MKKKPILCLAFGPIGDALIMLALFDDILGLDGLARFTVVTSSNARMIRDLASAYPSVEVREIPSAPFTFLKFLGFIFSRRWTVLVPGTAKYYSFHLKLFFLALSAIPGNMTIGFGDIRKKSGWLPFRRGLFVDIKIPVLDNYRKMVSYFMPVRFEDLAGKPTRVKLLPAPVPGDFPYLPGTYFVIHMFGTRPRLSFPPRRWRSLLLETRRRYPAYGIVLTGSKKDEKLIREISDGIEQVRICIGLPILEVAGIIEQGAAYIGVDTGVTHLAAMLRAPSVVVGNNSNPLWWPSYNPQGIILVNNAHCTCTGDKNDDCRVTDPEDGQAYYRCTYDIRDEDVWNALASKVRVEANANAKK